MSAVSCGAWLESGGEVREIVTPVASSFGNRTPRSWGFWMSLLGSWSLHTQRVPPGATLRRVDAEMDHVVAARVVADERVSRQVLQPVGPGEVEFVLAVGQPVEHGERGLIGRAVVRLESREVLGAVGPLDVDRRDGALAGLLVRLEGQLRDVHRLVERDGQLRRGLSEGRPVARARRHDVRGIGGGMDEQVQDVGACAPAVLAAVRDVGVEQAEASFRLALQRRRRVVAAGDGEVIVSGRQARVQDGVGVQRGRVVIGRLDRIVSVVVALDELEAVILGSSRKRLTPGSSGEPIRPAKTSAMNA